MAFKFPTQKPKGGFNAQLLKERIDFYQLEIFHKHFSRDPGILFNALRQRENELNTINLTKKQFELVFPASGLTDSSKFDTILAAKLIKKLCGNTISQIRWDNNLDPTDESAIADSIRLRRTHGKIQNDGIGITRKEYKVLYDEIKGPLSRLGCSLHEIKHLSPTFKYGITTNSQTNFIGREYELSHIHDTLLGNSAVTISGIPGIGKSELASQYCLKYGDKYDHVIYINGQSIEFSYREIATLLELHDITDINVIKTLVEEYFRNEKVLVVYDNVTDGDINLLQNVMSEDFKNVITTQLQDWGVHYEKISLGVWTEDQAMQYMLAHYGNQYDRAELKLLAEKLGYHPLAIEHATSFIKHSKINIRKYFDFLKDHNLKVISEKITLKQSQIETSIFCSFLLTIQKLQQAEPEAFKILSILAVLDGSFIGESWLTEFCEDEAEYTKVKRLLQGYSIIKCKKHITDIDDFKYLTIHSIYQQAVIFILQDQNILLQALETCLGKICLPRLDTSSVQTRNKQIDRQLAYLWKKPAYQDDVMEYFVKNESKTCFLKSLECFNPSSIPGNIVSFTRCYDDGAFEKLTKMLKLYERFNDALGFVSVFQGVSYKELGQYDKALDYLKLDPESKKGIFNVRIHASCCYILKGEVERGIELFDSTPGLLPINVIDVGRALYEIGMFDKSEKYFDKFLSYNYITEEHSTGIAHTMLDGFCKIMILKDNIDTSEFLYEYVLWYIGEYDSIPLRKKPYFRLLMFNICTQIHRKEVFEAIDFTQDLVKVIKENRESKEICFREVLYLASQWQKQGYYYRAFTAYRMVEMLRRELKGVVGEVFLHDFNNMDIKKEKDFCAGMLIRIFKIPETLFLA